MYSIQLVMILCPAFQGQLTIATLVLLKSTAGHTGTIVCFHLQATNRKTLKKDCETPIVSPVDPRLHYSDTNFSELK